MNAKYNTVVLVNDIQFNHSMQVQSYVYTNSIQKIQSSTSITQACKNFKKFLKSSSSQLGLKKIQEMFKA